MVQLAQRCGTPSFKGRGVGFLGRLCGVSCSGWRTSVRACTSWRRRRYVRFGELAVAGGRQKAPTKNSEDVGQSRVAVNVLHSNSISTVLGLFCLWQRGSGEAGSAGHKKPWNGRWESVDMGKRNSMRRGQPALSWAEEKGPGGPCTSLRAHSSSHTAQAAR
jgi:hypothetical protein